MSKWYIIRFAEDGTELGQMLEQDGDFTVYNDYDGVVQYFSSKRAALIYIMGRICPNYILEED